MGCDIHVIVERQGPDGKWRVVNPEPRPLAPGKYDYDWGSFQEELTAMEQLGKEMTPPEIWEPPRAGYWFFGRNYQAFAQLADVRSYREDANVFELRGFPDDASDLTFWEFHLQVDPDGTPYRVGGATEEQAGIWGRSAVVKRGQKVIQHPDWHSPNWILGSEMTNYKSRLKFQDEHQDRVANLGEALAKVAETYGIGLDQVRVVFWFDN